jgi:hypothetical protein
MEKYATVVFDEELFIHGLGQCGSKEPVFRVFRASPVEQAVTGGGKNEGQASSRAQPLEAS